MSSLIFLLACLLILQLSVVTAQRPCKSTVGEPGTCVKRSKCPFYNELYRKSNMVKQEELMAQYRCPTSKKSKFQVCCPSKGRGSVTRTGPKQHRNMRLLPEKICGMYLADKILGGTEAGIKEYPWLALLQYTLPSGRKTFGCGGSLISDRYVLTAAHCVSGIPENVTLDVVRLGEFDTATTRDCQDRTCSPPPQDIKVEQIIPHEEYRRDLVAQYFDIALLRLQRKATFTEYVTPLCLPFGEVAAKTYLGEDLVVAGWGRMTNEEGSNSRTKQKVSVGVVSREDCSPFYRANDVELRDTQLCAGGEADKGSCSGDSGGPLMSPDIVGGGLRWHATGIVSFGPTRCGLEAVPAVYTKVAAYTDWILDHMKG